jgi:hypothetical protein
MACERLPHLFFGWSGMLLEERGSREEHSRDTETALDRIEIDESLL